MSLTQNRTILLIDDDWITNLVSMKIIEQYAPFNVIAFTSARKALEFLEELLASRSDKLPELILLDINMPQMDGWGFLERFEELSDTLLDNCDLVMLTSSFDPFDIAKSKTFRSIKGFISKPLSLEKIESLISVDRPITELKN